jgi:conjugative transposon TraJ protein
MQKKTRLATRWVAAGLLLPGESIAQGGLGDQMHSLHEVLAQLYDEMMPLCSKLIGVGRGIAGFAATWYIASRVWRHISHAEPIDFYPLFRPFALGLAVLLFPAIIAMINGVMQPTVSATEEMVKDSDKAIETLLEKKEEAIKKTDIWQMYVGEDGDGDRDKWYLYTHPEDPTGENEGTFEGIGNDIKFAMSKAAYNFKNSIKQWLSEVLTILYEAASLCINTIRTFFLIVLAILGPLAFGIAVFDGFQHTLTVWIARYVNIFLWLPVANIFGSIIGKIQENMLKIDIEQINDYGDTFFSSMDVAYLVFLIIGIVGYFTVPSVANYIVQASGGNPMLHKVTSMSYQSGSSIIQAGAAGMGSSGNILWGSTDRQYDNPHHQTGGGKDSDHYMRDKLSGNA